MGNSPGVGGGLQTTQTHFFATCHLLIGSGPGPGVALQDDGLRVV